METQLDMKSNEKLFEQTLAIDFGNSRAKLVYKNIYKTFRYTQRFLEEFKNFFNSKVKPPIRVLYSNVNSEQANKIVDFLTTNKNVYVYDIRELILKQKRVNIFNYHWIGTDRILGLIGALEEFSAPIITVDIGTAITVNTVDSNRNFLGGLIFPGPETQLKSLSQNTSFLKVPKIVADMNLSVLEISTENAVSAGILNSIWGGLLYILNQIEIKVFGGNQPPIIFTGGGFRYFNSMFQQWEYQNKFYRKNLVLSGILSLAKFEKQYFIDFGDDK